MSYSQGIEMTADPQMTWREVVEGWSSDASCRLALRTRLLDVGEEAVLWETTRSIDGTEGYDEWIGSKPGLARRAPNARAFADHLRETSTSFPNLGGRSMLVSPPRTGPYGHLLAFARTAPDPLWHDLWQRVAEEVLLWWSQERGSLWVSTHGGGVPWLHIRLDPRPKYYQGPFGRK